VAVTGEVELPNLYRLPPETSLGQAIAAAGGVSEFGRMNDVRLIRDGQELVLDLRNPSGPVMEMRIRSGDQIRVPRRGSSFRDYLGLTASIVAAVGSVVAAIVAVANWRKCESAKVRKCGSAEVRKCGSAEVRKCGSAEVRKCGSAGVGGAMDSGRTPGRGE
jgi:hypothetical protein